MAADRHPGESQPRQRTAVHGWQRRPQAPAFLRLAVSPIRWMDRSLRVHYGIFEFTSDPRCVLRLSLATSPADVRLADGTEVSRGQTVGELHFWNERTMAIFRGGPTVRNAAEFRRSLHLSLRQVAQFVQRDARFADVTAFLARTSVSDQLPRERLMLMSRRWGFELDPAPATLPGRFADFWDNVHAALMRIAFVADGDGWPHPRRLERVRLWMSRRRLIAGRGGAGRHALRAAAAERP